MSGTYIGFDIGTRNLHAVVGQAEGTSVRIIRSINLELPRETITDGLISNKDALILVMQEALSRLAPVPREAVVTFNSNSIIIREFEVPAGDPKELEAMIKNEIFQYFGMLDTDLVEYRNIGETETNGIKKVKVRAAVMNRELARSYYDLLNDLKLKPLALDIHPNVIFKLFMEKASVNRDSGDNFLLMDIGYSGTMIYLFSQGSLSFFRFVSFGGRAIDRLLATVLTLPEEQAERKKLELLGQEKDGESLENNEGVALVSPIYGELLEELRKVLQFFFSRSGTKEMNQIYLMGGGASLAGLSSYISRGLGLEVSKLRSLSSIQLTDNENAFGSLVNAAGALIRH